MADGRLPAAIAGRAKRHCGDLPGVPEGACYVVGGDSVQYLRLRDRLGERTAEPRRTRAETFDRYNPLPGQSAAVVSATTAQQKTRAGYEPTRAGTERGD